MVNQVEISGGGSINGAVLQNAATEATLQRILSAIQRQGGGSSGSTAAQNLFNQTINTSTRTITQGTQAQVAYNNILSQTTTQLNLFSSALGGVSNVIRGTFGVALGAATTSIQLLTSYITNSYQNFLQLSQSGANFGNNMLEISRFALQSGMGLQEFTTLVKRGSDVLTALGGTASQGARRLGELRDNLVDGELSERLYGLGMTTSELEGYLVDYLGQQQRLGNVNRLSNRELLEATALYATELDKVSKLTGADRRRLEEQARRISMDPVFDAIRRGLNPTQLARSNANLAMAAEIGGNDLEEAIKEISTGVIQSDLGRELTRIGAISREEALAMAQGTAEAGPILQRALSVLNRQGEYADSTLVQANAQLRAGNMARMRLSRLSDADFQRAQEEQRNRDALSTAMGRIPQALRSTYNRLLGFFVNSQFFRNIESALGRFAQYFLDNIDPIRNYFSNLFDDLNQVFNERGLGAAIREGFIRLFNGLQQSGILTEISNFFKDLFNIERATGLWEGISKNIGDFFRGLFGLQPDASVTDYIKDSISEFIKDVFSRLFSSLWDSIRENPGTTLAVVGGLTAMLVLIFGGSGLLIGAVTAGLAGLSGIVLSGVRTLYTNIANNIRNTPTTQPQQPGQRPTQQPQQQSQQPGQRPTSSRGNFFRNVLRGGVAGVVAGVGGQVIDSVSEQIGLGLNEINEDLDQQNWQRMTTFERMQSGTLRSIESVGNFFGLSRITNEAIADRIRNETEYLERTRGRDPNRNPNPVIQNGNQEQPQHPPRIEPEINRRDITDQQSQNIVTGITTEEDQALAVIDRLRNRGVIGPQVIPQQQTVVPPPDVQQSTVERQNEIQFPEIPETLASELQDYFSTSVNVNPANFNPANLDPINQIILRSLSGAIDSARAVVGAVSNLEDRIANPSGIMAAPNNQSIRVTPTEFTDKIINPIRSLIEEITNREASQITTEPEEELNKLLQNQNIALQSEMLESFRILNQNITQLLDTNRDSNTRLNDILRAQRGSFSAI